MRDSVSFSTLDRSETLSLSDRYLGSEAFLFGVSMSIAGFFSMIFSVATMYLKKVLSAESLRAREAVEFPRSFAV